MIKATDTRHWSARKNCDGLKQNGGQQRMPLDSKPCFRIKKLLKKFPAYDGGVTLCGRRIVEK